VMGGYCSIERAVIDTRPARHIMMDMTVAKIGRSMKNLENIDCASSRLDYFAKKIKFKVP